MKIYLIKNNTGQFVPAYNSGYEKAKRFKPGETILGDLTRPRNIGFHRKFFALLNMGFENQEKYDDFEDYRAVFIMKAGFYKVIEVDKGVIYLPKSISFSKMDDIEFSELYSKMINVLIKELGLDQERIEKELSTFM